MCVGGGVCSCCCDSGDGQQYGGDDRHYGQQYHDSDQPMAFYQPSIFQPQLAPQGLPPVFQQPPPGMPFTISGGMMGGGGAHHPRDAPIDMYNVPPVIQDRPPWSWCGLVWAMCSCLCCPFFSLIGTVLAVLSYTDHRAGHYQSSSAKRRASYCFTLSAIAVFVLLAIALFLAFYTYHDETMDILCQPKYKIRILECKDDNVTSGAGDHVVITERSSIG